MSHEINNRCWQSALIIGYGEDIPKTLPAIGKDTLIITADGGLKHAQTWGLIPHVLLGDFDSLDLNQLEFDLSQTKIEKFPRDKDKTDLELAVDYALAHGIKAITFVGAWGSRIDHSLGNLELLYRLGKKHTTASIITAESEIHLVNYHLQLELPLGTVVSLIPLSEVVVGVSTSGLHYQLANQEIRKGSTWTISNKTKEKCIQISCESGILLLIVEKNPR